MSLNEYFYVEQEFNAIYYFGFIGSSFLSWLSGPDVKITDEGLSLTTTWLMDRTFPGKESFFFSWDSLNQATNIKSVRFLGLMPYIKLSLPEREKTVPYIPSFFQKNHGFLSALEKKLTPGCKLHTFISSRR